jgi:hypothetical protein
MHHRKTVHSMHPTWLHRCGIALARTANAKERAKYQRLFPQAA